MCRVQANPEGKQPKRCPACKTPLSASFMLLTMFFNEEQKQAGGKQLPPCPSPKCKCPLWVRTDGEIKVTSGCRDELLELLAKLEREELRDFLDMQTW